MAGWHAGRLERESLRSYDHTVRYCVADHGPLGVGDLARLLVALSMRGTTLLDDRQTSSLLQIYRYSFGYSNDPQGAFIEAVPRRHLIVL